MKHPFQNIVVTDTHLFATVKNHLLVFNVSDGRVVGTWEDTVNSQDNLKRLQLKLEKEKENEKVDEQTDEQPAKRGESNTKAKLPKIPTPGPGAPPIYNYIRSLQLTGDGAYLIGITDSDKSIIIFELQFSEQNCLKLVKRQCFAKRPCSVSIREDNKVAIVGDKFGDVYELGIDTKDPIEEKELKPILGHVSMLTTVLTAKHGDKQFLLTSDRDEHIRVTHYPQTYVIKHWLFGHDEFISSMVIPDFNEDLLVSAGGDDSIFLWDWFNQKLISSLNIRPFVEHYLTDEHLPPARFLTEESKRELTVIKLIISGRNIVVLLENMKCLVSLKINDDLSLELNKVKELEHPLIDISAQDTTLVAAVESSQLVQFFNINTLDQIENKVFAAISNPCNVESKNDFYPLYTINTLRKRSEH